jgi:hypothetical protein
MKVGESMRYTLPLVPAAYYFLRKYPITLLADFGCTTIQAFGLAAIRAAPVIW